MASTRRRLSCSPPGLQDRRKRDFVGRANAAGAGAGSPELTVLARLRPGDESMFSQVLDAGPDGMLRPAQACVPTDASAQDVAQGTWLAVTQRLDPVAGAARRSRHRCTGYR